MGLNAGNGTEDRMVRTAETGGGSGGHAGEVRTTSAAAANALTGPRQTVRPENAEQFVAAFRRVTRDGENLFIDASGLDLSGIGDTLKGARDLSFCWLVGANLNRTDCSGANFVGRDGFANPIDGATFHGANLVGASFVKAADLRLRGALCGGVRFVDCDFRWLNVVGADLTNADFSGSRIKDTATVTLSRSTNFMGTVIPSEMRMDELSRVNLFLESTPDIIDLSGLFGMTPEDFERTSPVGTTIGLGRTTLLLGPGKAFSVQDFLPNLSGAVTIR